VALVVFPLVCLFFVGFGLHTMWQSTVTLPRQYDRLEAQGVPATATVDECAPRLGGGRGVACRVTMTFNGSSRTWVYPENSHQFEILPAGSSVAMLVDPRDIHDAYTVTDVSARTNAGFGIVAGVGAFFAAVGVAGFAFMAWLRLRTRRLRVLDDV
jgi:hypothetical protein